MKKLSMYCMALNNENLEIIKGLNYIPVGLKNNNFSDGNHVLHVTSTDKAGNSSSSEQLIITIDTSTLSNSYSALILYLKNQ